MSARLPTLIVALALVALAAAFSLLDIVSWDYWWQLRTGRLIWETGAVPHVDPYSFTASGSPYVDIHWLFQLGLFATHALGGHAAVVLAKLGFVALTVALLAPIGARRDRAAVSGLVLALALVLLAERIMLRAELPSFVLLAAVLLCLDRMRGSGVRFAWIAIVGLQLVWVNTHGLFAVGIAVCGLHLAGDLFDRWSRGEVPGGQAHGLAAALAGGVAVSFVNPSGLRGALYPIAQLDMIGAPETRLLGADIVELQPTLGNASPEIVAAALALSVLTVAALVLNRRRVPARDWLLLVAFVYLGLSARRNLALFAIVVAPIAVTHWNAWLDRHPASWSRRRGFAGAVALAAVAALVVVDVVGGDFHRRLGVSRDTGLGVMRTWFSLGAVDWIAAERPPGPIAHTLPDGGLVIERLYPDYRVMIDGRLEVYGPERLERLAWSTPDSFLPLHREHRFGTVVVHYSKVPSREMLRWLYRRPAWKLVFVDEVSAVFVRESGDGGRFTALDVDADDLFAPFVDAGPTQTELRLRGRALFYSALDRQGKARAAVELAHRLYPDIELSSGPP